MVLVTRVSEGLKQRAAFCQRGALVGNDSRLKLGLNYNNGIKVFEKVILQNPSPIIDWKYWSLGKNYLHSELERVCAHGAGLCPVQSSDIWRGLELENLIILQFWCMHSIKLFDKFRF